MKTKIQALLNQLNDGLVERENVIRLALLAVLAGENVILVGPPGTGKSLIARRIASCLDAGEGGHFEYLLTKFSTPEEIFGPLSITELKADRFRRNTAGYLPSVKLAFLDEVFKASSSILNSLLTILNERRYHNGTEVSDVPLRALIGASNELPVGQDELNALYDRFLLRGFVDYVSEKGLLQLFAAQTDNPIQLRLSDDDLQTIRDLAGKVEIPQEIAALVQRIWIEHKSTFKEDNREGLSDRRLMKAINLMRVSATTNGREQVDYSDVLLLKDCLWNHHDNRAKVTDLVLNSLRAQSAFSSPFSATQSIAELLNAQGQSEGQGRAVKGLRGTGGKYDPYLVSSFQDLERLTEADIGTAGFHFRQTADIDCSDVAVWLKARFKGHYDGAGHTITYRRDEKAAHALFNAILDGSEITDLRLQGLSLSKRAEGASISRCSTDVELIRGNVLDCDISSCQSGSFLLYGDVEGSRIADCLAVLDSTWNAKDSDREAAGGIAASLKNGSVVERCLVTGRLSYVVSGGGHFAGIATKDATSSIKQSALGKFQLESTSHLFYASTLLQNRFLRIASGNASNLQQNVALDCVFGDDEPNGLQGKTLDEALFKQAYFENSLNWDFATVWQWDAKENRPALRMLANGGAREPAMGGESPSLLAQQVAGNIWL